MADRYWRGGTGTWDTTTTTNWSATSGGSGGASVPTASDNVIFDQSATYNVTMTGALACLSITVSAGTVSFITGTTPTLQVNGSMSLVSGTVWTSTGAITFNSTTTGQTITTNGTTMSGAITFNGTGGGWTLGSALTTLATLTTTLTAGALSLNNFNLTTGIFSSTNSNTRSIAFGTGNIILTITTAASTVVSMAIATGFTYTSSGTFGSGTGCFQATMSATRTFTFGTTGGSTSNAPNLYLDSGASVATITTAGWWNEINFGTTSFTIGTTNLNLNSLYSVNSTAVLTTLTATMVGTGTVDNNATIGPLVINSTNGTTTIADNATTNVTTCTITSGTLYLPSSASTLTCSSTFTMNGGTLNNLGVINCTTFTLGAATYTMSTGTITPSTSFVTNNASSAFTYSGGTLSTVATFTQTAGNVTFNKSYSLTVTGTYTLTAGALTLAPSVNLSTGIFSSTGAGTRSIGFGSTLTTASGSILFNGTTQYLSLTGTTNDALDLATGAGDWTVETWVYLSNVTNTQVLFEKGGNTGYTNPSYAFTVVAGGTSQWIVGNGSTGGAAQSGGTFVANTWYHVALVRNGSTLTSYLNGVQTSTVLMTFIMSNTNNNTLTIASSVADGSTNYLAGYLSNFRIVKGVAVYTSAFTPSTTQLTSTQLANTNGNPSAAILGSQTSLLLNMQFGTNYLLDSSTYKFTVTNNNSAISKTSAPFDGIINLTHTTAATVVLNMAALGGFTWTGSGGFTVANMANTRTLSVGNTSGGSTVTAPNLTFTTGASIATLTTGSWFNNLDYGTTTYTQAASTVNITGNIILASGGTYTALTISMTGTGTIYNTGKTITAVTVNTTGTATLSAALTMSGALTLTQGTLLCPYAITSASFASAGALTKTMTGTNITYTVSGAGATAFSNTGTGLTMTGLTISMTNAAAKTFAGGGGTYPVLNQGGAGALTISGSNTFDNFTNTTQPATITTTAATTQTFNNFSLAGIAGSLITLNSSTATTAYTFTKPSGIVYGSYLSITDSAATGGATWYAGPTSTSVSNNTGWVFTQLPIVFAGALSINTTAGGITISDAAVI